MAELMLGQPLFPGESGIDQLVEIIKVLGTPTREQIKTMNPNYMEHKFPQIKPHPFSKVCRSTPKHQSEIIGFARTGVGSTTSAAAEYVTSLKEEHSHIFWPQWSQVAFSSICFLDLLMAVSSPSTEEAVIWFQRLHVVRRQMRLKANMLPVLRLGLLRIDAVYWKGVEKVVQLSPHVL